MGVCIALRRFHRVLYFLDRSALVINCCTILEKEQQRRFLHKSQLSSTYVSNCYKSNNRLPNNPIQGDEFGGDEWDAGFLHALLTRAEIKLEPLRTTA